MIRLVIACAVLAAAIAAAASASTPLTGDGVWAAGTVDNLAVTGPAPAGAHVVPLYVIAPVSDAHPLHPLADARTHGFGAHDHVIALGAGATYQGSCDLTLVVAGPTGTPQLVRTRATLTPAGKRPLLYAAVLAGTLKPLTSAARIADAIRLGIARPVDTHTALACTVTPRSTP